MQEEEYEETVYDYETVEEEYEAQVIDEETGEFVVDEETGEFVTETKTREVKRPVMIEVEETVMVPDFDEETGEYLGEHEETVTRTVHKSHVETRTYEMPVQVGSHTETRVIPYPVRNPHYEEEQAEIRSNEFHRAFFNTSLGYIRRIVTMADGSHKDFLSDLLPVISMGVSQGQQVSIIAYDEPDFMQEEVDWAELQHVQTVTPQFIQECFLQLSNDFLPTDEQ